MTDTQTATRTVLRFAFAVDETEHILDLPGTATIINVDRSYSDPFKVNVWAEVPVDAPSGPRRFRLIRTGEPIPDDRARYVGTARYVAGHDLVLHDFHLYELF